MIKVEIATEESLREEMLEFERRYGVDSFELYEMRGEDRPEHIPPWEANIWCGVVERWHRVRSYKTSS
jgi:hypothetical protein